MARLTTGSGSGHPMVRVSVQPDSFEAGHRRGKKAVRKELRLIGQEIEKEAVRWLDRNDHNMDGDLRRITSEVQQLMSGALKLIVGPTARHGEWFYKGRETGKWPPVDAMRYWVRKKLGIADRAMINSIAYLVGRKIHDQGIEERPGFLDEPFRQAQRGLERRLKKVYTDAF